MTTLVFCKTTFEGIHCWDTIPLSEPAQYLKFPHRHIFHVQVGVEVDHNDRDVEIITLKHAVDEYIAHLFPDKCWGVPDMGHCSCEMLAEQLKEEFGAVYVIVSEDNENGAICFRWDEPLPAVVAQCLDTL